MSGLCGWIGRPAHACGGTERLHAMAHAITRFDGALACTAGSDTGAVAAAAVDGGALVRRNGDRLIAMWGGASAHARNPGAPGRDLAQYLFDLYERHGEYFVERLSGEFALALIDGARGLAMISTDRMGTRPLYYAGFRGGIAFASRLDALDPCIEEAPRVDPQAIYDYVHFHMVPAPGTAYVGRKRLLPGTQLIWRNGGSVLRRYWRMRYIEDLQAPLPLLENEFRGLLRASVRAAAGSGPVGAFLSGGTDSSTVAGMLRDVTGERPRTYSIGFEAEGYDETDYARIAARHFNARHRLHYVTPDEVVTAVPLIAAVHDQPFGNASAVPAYYCAALAKADGVITLLGGDGGDELFGGNDRYAKQYLYSLYGDLPEALRRFVAEPIAALLPESGLAGTARRYMRNAAAAMPARYDNYNLLQRLGPATVFTAEFLDGVNTGAPQAALADAYAEAQARSLINRMLALDLRHTLADNDLPKVMRSCELAGVAARFPLLDDGLVAFSARLPPRLKLRRTQLRWFFKKALRDFLPAEIIAKRKHGFGLPFGVWLQREGRLRDLAFDSLSALKRRRIVNGELIDELMLRHVAAHASYFGTLVWVLMMLEQWLAQRATARLEAASSRLAVPA